MQECWVSIMLMWSILGLGCRTLRLAPSKFYGCDGMKLLTQIQGLQDGIVWHWTCCASHPYTKTIPLALWIQKLYYDGVISSQHLTRENEKSNVIWYQNCLSGIQKGNSSYAPLSHTQWQDNLRTSSSWRKVTKAIQSRSDMLLWLPATTQYESDNPCPCIFLKSPG